MKTSKLLNKFIFKKFSSNQSMTMNLSTNIESPLILLMNYNQAVYNTVGLSPMKLFTEKIKKSGVKNFRIVPILTNSQTNLQNRIMQVNKQFEELVKLNYKNVNIFCYSMSNLALNGYINEYYKANSKHESESFIKSITYISCPNK